MTTPEIIAYNEAYAIEQIRAAYKAGDMFRAMQLVKTYMGIDEVGKARNKAEGICADLILREEGK